MNPTITHRFCLINKLPTHGSFVSKTRLGTGPHMVHSKPCMHISIYRCPTDHGAYWANTGVPILVTFMHLDYTCTSSTRFVKWYKCIHERIIGLRTYYPIKYLFSSHHNAQIGPAYSKMLQK